MGVDSWQPRLSVTSTPCHPEFLMNSVRKKIWASDFCHSGCGAWVSGDCFPVTRFCGKGKRWGCGDFNMASGRPVVRVYTYTTMSIQKHTHTHSYRNVRRVPAQCCHILIAKHKTRENEWGWGTSIFQYLPTCLLSSLPGLLPTDVEDSRATPSHRLLEWLVALHCHTLKVTQSRVCSRAECA